jgi:hypothetical protein
MRLTHAEPRFLLFLKTVQLVSRAHRHPLEIQTLAETFECAMPSPLEETTRFGIFLHFAFDPLERRLGRAPHGPRWAAPTCPSGCLRRPVLRFDFTRFGRRGVAFENRSTMKLTRDILPLLAALEFTEAKKRRGEHRLRSSGPPCLCAVHCSTSRERKVIAPAVKWRCSL